MRSTASTSHGSGDYEVDYLIPLELGGSNSIKKLWPESHRTSPWNAQVKVRLEGKLHELVCSGQMDLKTAHWIEPYKMYVSPNPSISALASPTVAKSPLNFDQVWVNRSTRGAGSIGNPDRDIMVKPNRGNT